MMIGGFWGEIPIGSIVDFIDKRNNEEVGRAKAQIMCQGTRDEYLTQQKERGLLEEELADPWSIVNRATHFYWVSVD